jgi:Vibrio phage DNA polymerase
MPRARKIATCDCETDPFLKGRIVRPFVWGFYDGKEYRVFHSTQELVNFVKPLNVILYAHNGGKFDFMYLLTYVGETRAQIINGRIISMRLGECELRDSFAVVPQGLGSIKKDEIEYWKMNVEHREKYMDEIIQYMRGDCVYLYELMSAYRKAAGTSKTIASNALAHAKKLGIDPGTTNHRFDARMRPFYHGGRTQCFRPGTWENISLFDIHSSYPRAMQEYHPTGSDFHRNERALEKLSREEIQRSFIELECYADGCFPLRTEENPGLHFPSQYATYRVTGWEYIAAKELGLIEDEKILEVRYTDAKITCADYVEHWYNFKESHPKKTDPINYTIGKVMMVSLYGKLSQDIEKYHDYKIVENDTKLPCITPRPYSYTSKTHSPRECRICGFDIDDHGWQFYTLFEGKTFHRRPSLWKHQQRYGDEWEMKPLYKNVATGASITGYARAALLRAIHAVGREHIIYCDTDSLVLDQFADRSKLPQSSKIGDWACEIDNAPISHFCGKKTYAIDLGTKDKCTCIDRKGTCKRHKVVTKGARLTFDEIARVVNGEEIEYFADAPSFSLARGIVPVHRLIRRTA